MNQGLESLGRIRLQGFALLTVAFVVGAFAGGAAERVLASRRAPFGPAGRPPTGRMFRPGELPPYYGRLGLTSDQRTRIDGILEHRRAATDSLMDQILPQMREMADSTRAEIRTVLTAEQREQLDREAPRGFRRDGLGVRGEGGAGPGRRPRPPRP